MSPKLLKKQAARQEREARKAGVKYEAPRPFADLFKVLASGTNLQMLQAYDPATIGNHRLLKLNVFWKNNRNGGFGFSVPEALLTDTLIQQVVDYFKESDNQHDNHIIENGTTVVECYLEQIEEFAQTLNLKVGDHRTIDTSFEQLIVIFNILWLTARGLMPNDEYNGVVVMVETLPGERKVPENYTPNSVGSHTRMQNGKLVTVRSYKRGFKLAA